ncbi:hypothetical protein JG687_00013151, partial [Phytophthora cactorum]
VIACSAVAQVVALYAESCASRHHRPKSNILTVTALRFEPMLQSAAYASWFEDNLLCTRLPSCWLLAFYKNMG